MSYRILFNDGIIFIGGTLYRDDALVGWLSLTSHRQRGHLETAPPFTVPCEGREAQ